ncbi:hypothetical protein KAU11_10515 [Candidatus Babeliales bacterium]|nr:hypothetical protein [Candidatus Babeliales bacterium]
MSYRHFDNTQEELIEVISIKHGRSVREVKKILRLYAKTIKELMKFGDIENGKPFAKKIKLANVGTYLLKERGYRKSLFKELEEYSNLEHKLNAMMFIDIHEWALFKWDMEEGFVFVNYVSGEVYKLKERNLFNSYNAVVRFAEIINDRRVVDGIDFNYAPSFTPIQIKTVAKYDNGGSLVGIYDNIITAVNTEGFNVLNFRLYLNKNSRKYNTNMKVSTYGGYIWFFIEGSPYKTLRLNISLKEIKHNFYIDMLNLSGEVVVKRMGRPFEVANFLEATTKYTNVKVSPILRVLDTDNSMYGYKWKRSIQSSIGEEES